VVRCIQFQQNRRSEQTATPKENPVVILRTRRYFFVLVVPTEQLSLKWQGFSDRQSWGQGLRRDRLLHGPGWCIAPC